MNLFLQQTLNGFYNFLTNVNYRKFLYLAFIYGSSKRYHRKNISVLNYRLQVPDALSFIWQFKEIFADESYKFESELTDPVIYDCGSNIGLSCIYFKKLFPAAIIKAFEADPNIAKYLNNNLYQNGFTDVEVIEKAVWIEDGEIDINSEGADASTIFSSDANLKVESVRLKKLLEKEQRVDLLKMDIEGAEVQVLNDCRNNLSSVRNIFIEFHSYTNDKQKLSKLISVLEENNFRYFIKPVADREKPFINKINKFNPAMDLQLNIFAYKIN